MPTAEELLARTSGRTDTVWVCPDVELLSRWRQAQEHYDRARRQLPGNTLGNDETAELKAEADDLAAQVDDALVELKLKEVRPPRVRALQADHSLKKAEAEKLGLRAGALNNDSFWPALAAEAFADPEFTVEQAEEFMSSSIEVWDPIVKALDKLHGGGGDPKAEVDTARRRNGVSS